MAIVIMTSEFHYSQIYLPCSFLKLVKFPIIMIFIILDEDFSLHIIF